MCGAVGSQWGRAVGICRSPKKVAVAFLVLLVAAPCFRFAPPARAATPQPIRIGIDAEFSLQGSTSAQAIALGARIAADEINAAGGLLGGRTLQLVEKDNRSVPARSIVNLEALAADPAVVAVIGGRFSPVVVDDIPEVHRLGLPLLDAWGAADTVTDNDYPPRMVFRLSLRDQWAIAAIVKHAAARGLRRLGLLVPNTEWGRSSTHAARALVAADPRLSLAGIELYDWGERTMLGHYLRLQAAGADVLVMVVNDREGIMLINEMAALPAAKRLPVLAHWGITGGNFFEGTRAALPHVDLLVVQTYSFIGATDPVARRVLAAAARLGAGNARTIASPVGVAQAYDLVHILARAIALAGTTDRMAVRDALERVTDYRGLVRFYARPFTPDRHEALSPDQVFLARYAADGAIERVSPP